MGRYNAKLKANLSYIPDNDNSLKGFYKKHAWTIWIIIFAIIGTVLTSTSMYGYFERQYILENGVTTTGHITDIRHQTTSRNGMSSEEITFTDLKNRQYRFSTSVSPSDAIGQSKSVTYLESEPKRAVTTDEADTFDVLFVVSVPLFVVFVAIMLWIRFKQK